VRDFGLPDDRRIPEWASGNDPRGAIDHLGIPNRIFVFGRHMTMVLRGRWFLMAVEPEMGGRNESVDVSGTAGLDQVADTPCNDVGRGK